MTTATITRAETGQCRVIIPRSYRRCEHLAALDVNGVGFCRIHYAMIRRGKSPTIVREEKKSA